MSVQGERVAPDKPVQRLQRIRVALFSLVIAAFAVELISRYIDDVLPLTGEFMSLGAILTLAVSVLIFAQVFVQERVALLTLWMAAAFGLTTSGLRLSEQIGRQWFQRGPFEDIPLYPQILVGVDFATVAFLFIGMLLLVFDSTRARIRLAEKTDALQRLAAEHERTERERKDLEQQLFHAQKTESVALLAGGLAHDYNNLLTGILGNARLALDDLSADSPVREAIQQIEYGASRAAYLTDQLLTYGGETTIAAQAVDLSRLVRDMVGLMEIAVSKSIALKLDLETELPMVRGDMTQIRHVILNLVTNASEALDDQRGSIAVRTGTRECSEDYLQAGYAAENLRPGQYVYLSVEDTGPGMDEETLARICDPFFSTKFPGRGLGLSAVLGIAQAHGAALRIESQPNAGTRVVLLFPVTTETGIHTNDEAQPPANAGDTILVVEDEELVRRVAVNILKRAGYFVLEAADGEEALDIFGRHHEAISDVLLDLTLPGIDGPAVREELRRIEPNLNLVVASGRSTREIRDALGDEDGATVIRKPYRPDDLLRAFPPVSENPTNTTSRRDIHRTDIHSARVDL